MYIPFVATTSPIILTLVLDSWIDAGTEDSSGRPHAGSASRAPAGETTTRQRPGISHTSMYIDVEEDLTLESVILSSEYNGFTPLRHASGSQHNIASSDDDDDDDEYDANNKLGNGYEYDSAAEEDGSEGEEASSAAYWRRRHLRSSTSPQQQQQNQQRPGPQSPSDIDLRASFSTLLHRNYASGQKKGPAAGPDRGAALDGGPFPHKSSSVRLSTVCLVPESEMNHHRGQTTAVITPGGEQAAGTAATTSGSRSSRSSSTSSASASDKLSSPHRRRRKSAKPEYSSGGRPFSQVDLSTVSLAAAGLSLVAGLSFSAGYALGRRSDMHLAVAS